MALTDIYSLFNRYHLLKIYIVLFSPIAVCIFLVVGSYLTSDLRIRSLLLWCSKCIVCNTSLCYFLRARGTELVSPKDLLEVIDILRVALK